jgi:hypothetical protein
MSTDTKYNGWTNYATWRVNLEVFDGLNPVEMWPELIGGGHAYELSKHLAEYVDEVITEYGGRRDGLAVDYARAFLEDVNFYEIAESMIDNYATEAA